MNLGTKQLQEITYRVRMVEVEYCLLLSFLQPLTKVFPPDQINKTG